MSPKNAVDEAEEIMSNSALGDDDNEQMVLTQRGSYEQAKPGESYYLKYGHAVRYFILIG